MTDAVFNIKHVHHYAVSATLMPRISLDSHSVIAYQHEDCEAGYSQESINMSPKPHLLPKQSRVVHHCRNFDKLRQLPACTDIRRKCHHIDASYHAQASVTVAQQREEYPPDDSGIEATCHD
jgi:hypothetical protein